MKNKIEGDEVSERKPMDSEKLSIDRVIPKFKTWFLWDSLNNTFIVEFEFFMKKILSEK